MVILRFAICRIYEVIQHVRFLGDLHGSIGKDDSILSDDASRAMVMAEKVGSRPGNVEKKSDVIFGSGLFNYRNSCILLGDRILLPCIVMN